MVSRLFLQPEPLTQPEPESETSSTAGCRTAMTIKLMDVPEQAEWRITLMGTAVAQAATLVAESVYAVPVENSPL